MSTLTRFIKIFEKSVQIVDQRTQFSFGKHHFSEDITLVCLETAEIEQPDYKKVFVGAVAYTYYSMVRLGDVNKFLVKLTI